ncbi:MAG: hypothetical protein ACI93N_000047 [Flavobacteriaceae bacterium]|jgi:hypothetical protein
MEHTKFSNSSKYPIAKSYIIKEFKTPKKHDLMKQFFIKIISNFYK